MEEMEVKEKKQKKVKKVKAPKQPKELNSVKKVGISNDKKIIIAIITIVLVLALGIFGWFYYNTSLKPVVSFKGGNLTTSEFSIYYKTFAPMLEYYGYSADAIPDQIAQKAAVDKILLIKAKEAGVTLKAEDKAKVDETFSKADEVKKFVDQGIDPDKMKQLYYNDYIISAYIEKLKTEFSNEEVTAYLKTTYGETVDMTEFVTRHILFSTIDSTTGAAMTDDKKAEVKAKAQSALARVLAGEDFAKLAKELSEDPGTKDLGGVYKMYLDENTVAEYKKAVEGLAVGATTTALVETSYGYHIIKLDEKVAGGRVNSDADRTQMANNKIDEMGKTVDLKVNKEVLTKVVETITGKKATSTTDTTNTTGTTQTQTEGTTDTTTDTTTGK